MAEPAILVVGVGNALRGDDAAGLAAVRALAARGLPPGVEAAECDGAADRLIALWAGRRAVVAVDAAGGGVPGTIRRFDAAAAPLPAGGLRPSTHAFGLAEAVELARALGELPPACTVHAIAGASFAHGEPLSPAVRTALPALVDALAAEVGRLMGAADA